VRAVEEGMELIARGDTWAAARAELEGVTGVLASDGGKELVGGEVNSVVNNDLFLKTFPCNHIINVKNSYFLFPAK
jgi:hypothetical protein